MRKLSHKIMIKDGNGGVVHLCDIVKQDKSPQELRVCICEWNFSIHGSPSRKEEESKTARSAEKKRYGELNSK